MRLFLRSVRLAFVTLMAAAFIALPIDALLTTGPFAWHIKQPAAWQGGLEVLLLAAALFGAFSCKSHIARVCVAFVALAFFARRHGVDLSIAAVYLYLEALFAVGWALLPVAGFARNERAQNLQVAGLIGVIAWSLTVWGLSALGFGTLDEIRVYTVVFLGVPLLISRRLRLGSYIVRRLPATDFLQRAGQSFAIAFVVALFAKASVTIDFDSFWYGLQAEKMLVGAGNLYRGQGLASVAHYYPKLYEALLLPFSGFGSNSMVVGLAIASVTMIMVVVVAILREFGVDHTARLYVALAAGTIPAIANIGITAKGDTFSALLMLLGVFALIRLRKGDGGRWMWIALSALMLSVLARLSNLPYAALLAVLVVAGALHAGLRGEGWSVLCNRGVWVFIAAGVLSGLVLARSYLLTGLPFVAPNALVALERSLGFELKYPIGLLPPDDGLPPRLQIIDGLRSFLFDPSSLPHVMITWTANVWLFIPLAAILLGARSGRKTGAWPVAVLGLSFFAVLFGYKFIVKGGDGNYFIVPILCLLIAGATLLSGLPVVYRRFFALLLSAFVLFDAAIALVTGSWGPGTRAFDTVMTRTPFELKQRTDNALGIAHMRGVARFFSDKAPGTRTVGVEIEGLGNHLPPGGWLPVQYEPLHAYVWQQPALVRSSAAIDAYLAHVRIEYLIVPTAPTTTAWAEFDRRAKAAIDPLLKSGYAREAYKDTDYTVFKLLPRMLPPIPSESVSLVPARPRSANDYTVHVKFTQGGEALAEVGYDQICGGGRAVVTLTWTAKQSVSISVRGSQDGAWRLWAEGSSIGSKDTGPWVSPGAEFQFRANKDGPELGVIHLSPVCDRSKNS